MGQIKTPFRFRELNKSMLVTNEVGDFHLFSKDFPDKYALKSLDESEAKALEDLFVEFPDSQKWRLAALKNRIRWSQNRPELNYLILIPTLRCDLSCTYCQVSRAPVNSRGYDWDEETLQKVLTFISKLKSKEIKIEFQGGEPTLRIDLIQRVIEFCDQKFEKHEYVICSNMTTLSNDVRALLERDDFSISTSIDGDDDIMTINRTQDLEKSKAILKNIKEVQSIFGHNKISALPTITSASVSAVKSLVNQYIDLGFSGVFLRPVNYMGFARKKHSESHDWGPIWEDFYRESIEHIASVNKKQYFEEYSLSVLLKTVLLGTDSGFVDHRSPANYATDYLLIDYDGTFFPTDESRMLSRIGQIDLQIGNVSTGIDKDKLSAINKSAIHQDNPDCIHCAYMPYCGVDIIDDLSRYGRIDLAKTNTWFCNRQKFLLDMIFKAYESKNTALMDPFLMWAYHKSSPVGYGGLYD